MIREGLEIILGRKKKDHSGPGLPRGLVMEVRAVLIVLFGLALIFFLTLWANHQEKQVYLNSPIEKTATAAGQP